MMYTVKAVVPNSMAVPLPQLRIAIGMLTAASATPPRLSTARTTRQINAFGGSSWAHPAQTKAASPKIAPTITRSRG